MSLEPFCLIHSHCQLPCSLLIFSARVPFPSYYALLQMRGYQCQVPHPNLAPGRFLVCALPHSGRGDQVGLWPRGCLLSTKIGTSCFKWLSGRSPELALAREGTLPLASHSIVQCFMQLMQLSVFISPQVRGHQNQLPHPYSAPGQFLAALSPMVSHSQ